MRARRVARSRRPLAARLFDRVQIPADVNQCWIWTGPLRAGGYGAIREGGRGSRTLGAHRVMYELTQGPIPIGLVVCHRCDVPQCVNPAHLFVGRVKDNVEDMHAKGRARKRKPTHCPQGHEYTPDNTLLHRPPAHPHLVYRACRICRNVRRRRVRVTL